jgi:spore maturation protein CgeB
LATSRSLLHTLVTTPTFPIDRDTMVLAYGCILASKRYRLDLLRALPQHLLHLTGDAHWAHLLPRANHHGTTGYGEELANVFRNTAISVNATNLQMPCTVNQRVFDVPATQGFLITDHQEEMDAYFKLGHDQDMVVFGCAQELTELVAYYRKYPEKRQRMAQKARMRVLAEHTYHHRMQTLIAAMRRDHGSLPAGAVITKPLS